MDLASVDQSSQATPSPSRPVDGGWRRRFPRRAGGFTLVELLVIIAILGIIFILIIPNFLVSLQKAKQKRTMADMHDIGKAMMAWLSGQAGAAAAGAAQVPMSDYGPVADHAELYGLLVPRYLGNLPPIDGWGNPLEYYLRTDNPGADAVMAIRSAGSDGVFLGDTYELGPFLTTDFSQDLVWADGIFIRWPIGHRP